MEVEKTQQTGLEHNVHVKINELKGLTEIVHYVQQAGLEEMFACMSSLPEQLQDPLILIRAAEGLMTSILLNTSNCPGKHLAMVCDDLHKLVTEGQVSLGQENGFH